MTTPIELVPHRLQKHYCRICGEEFPETRNNQEKSPHAAVIVHTWGQHSPDEPYVSCSRYCPYREQSEEREAGKRIYGQGLEHPHGVMPTPLRAYHELFPAD